MEVAKKMSSSGGGRSLFPYFMGGALLLEGALLVLVPIRMASPPSPPPPAFRVALAPPPSPLAKPKPPEPKTRSKSKVVAKTVVRRPVSPPSLPQATATSTNILAASVGTVVNMSWGEAAPEAAGGGAGYQPPRLLTKVDTDALYTDKMKADDEEGDVVVDLWIDSKGKILRSKMTVPSVWDDMNKIALKVLKNLKFAPAVLKGQAVAGMFELNFRFRIRNSG